MAVACFNMLHDPLAKLKGMWLAHNSLLLIVLCNESQIIQKEKRI
jgi:hypothetical protein